MGLLLFCGVVGTGSDHAQLGIREMHQLRRDFPALIILSYRNENAQAVSIWLFS